MFQSFGVQSASYLERVEVDVNAERKAKNDAQDEDDELGLFVSLLLKNTRTPTIKNQTNLFS